MKIGWLILLIFHFSQSVSAQNGCFELFEDSSDRLFKQLDYRRLDLLSVYLTNRNRFLLNTNDTLDLATVYPKYKGQPLRPIINTGTVNDGIFQFQDPVYGPSILKLYKFNEEHLEKLRETTSLYVYAAEDTLSVMMNVRGNLLAQDFNGPKLYDSGFIKSYQGEFYFYLQMESMFIGTSFYSLKNAVRDQRKRLQLYKILKTHPHVRNKIIDMFNELNKFSIVPFDPDVAISKDGEVRWIDTDLWSLGDPSQIAVNRDYLISMLDDVKKSRFRF